MAEYESNLRISNIGTRNDIRMSVVDVLSNEIPGTGKGALASRYTYYVESLADGRRVYLRRPANLHNGFDFIVCVEDTNFNANGRRRNYPTHDNIINDLSVKHDENPRKYETLYSVLYAIYTCSEIPQLDFRNNDFTSGFPCDLIIKVLKWLFIEQDIRYWNYSGRDMLWNGIYNINH